MLGAIEAGGTKFVCAIGKASGEIVDETRIETRGPKETLDDVIAFFRGEKKYAAFGIGSFGPIDLRRGWITSTPKKGWKNFDIVGAVREAFRVPIGFMWPANPNTRRRCTIVPTAFRSTKPCGAA